MRKTKLSIAVQLLFDQLPKPLSVADVQSRLKNIGFTPNKTTLYRMLDRFCAEGMTKKVILKDEMAYYEKSSDPHAHFVCTACDDIQCLSNFNPNQLISKTDIAADMVTVTSAHLALKGLCSNCS